MDPEEMRIRMIARICHEANRVYCSENSDPSQAAWENAPAWQRESAIKGVEFALANPDALDSAQHDAWMADKVANGWIYGETKDASAKTHPCLVPFHWLPYEQQIKDRLFRNIVRTFA